MGKEVCFDSQKKTLTQCLGLAIMIVLNCRKIWRFRSYREILRHVKKWLVHCVMSWEESAYALSPWPWSAKQIDLVFHWLTMSSSEQSMFLTYALWLLHWINPLLHFVPCKSCLFFSQLKSISVTKCTYSIKVNSVNCVLRQRINQLFFHIGVSWIIFMILRYFCF